MTILHITNSYGGTAVYTNLYSAIDQISKITQWVYVPLNSRNRLRVGNMLIDYKNRNSRIYYATVLKSYHSYLYGLKISTIVKNVEGVFDMTKVDLIHASTLCFDGAVAYELSKKYGIPFIVAVRNTDVNSYYRKLIWRKAYFTKILEKAQKVIFISPKYRENFLKNQVSKSKYQFFENKMIVLPNGLNKLFLDNLNTKRKQVGQNFSMIYVAAFYKGKGLIETMKAIEYLRNKGYSITLNAIGMGLPNRPQDLDYINMVESFSKEREWITLKPYKKPMEVIEEMRQSDAFIMVSSPETFGLVYVESLSQKLPIIYAKNEGFDNFFPDGFVGYPAKFGNIEDIAKKIELLIQNYAEIQNNIFELNLNKDFNWENIAHKYVKIYNEIINK